MIPEEKKENVYIYTNQPQHYNHWQVKWITAQSVFCWESPGSSIHADSTLEHKNRLKHYYRRIANEF